ncbi:MAG: TorF family putative porin [Rhodothermales bacterium]
MLVGPRLADAQSFSLGADFVSRYVWRGVDFGESLSTQPSLEFSAGAFTIGSWASYSISASGAYANEHDLYASVALGPITVGITDYYFPFPEASEEGLDFFNYDDGGAHYLELNVGAGGTDSFPLSVSANIFFHNDDDNSVYVQLDYPFTVQDVDLGVTAAFVPMESAFYGTSNFGFVNLGLTGSREIKITDSFSLPVFVSYIINPTPDAARSFLVFGFSL